MEAVKIFFRNNFLLILSTSGLIVVTVYAFIQYTNDSLQEARINALERQLQVIANSLSSSSILDEKSTHQLQEIKNRQTAASRSESGSLTSAVKQVSPSVVSIVVSKDVPKLRVNYVNPFGDDPVYGRFDIRIPVYEQMGVVKQKIGAGTGFFVTSNGYILTNRHVVEDQSAEYTVLLPNGDQKVAKVLYKDPDQDIALLKVEGAGFSVAKFGDSAKLELGETVAAIGNALGEYNNSVSVGVVSGINREVTVYDKTGTPNTLSGVLQTDAAINPGNSGGPLFNLRGEVIGVNVAAIIGNNDLGFSIPINTVKNIINKVLK